MEREDVIELASRIKELRAEASRLAAVTRELKTLELRLDAMLGLESNFETASLTDRLEQFLNGRPQEEFSAETLAKFLDAKITSIRAALSRLASEARIEKRGRGNYCAVRPRSIELEDDNTSPVGSGSQQAEDFSF